MNVFFGFVLVLCAHVDERVARPRTECLCFAFSTSFRKISTACVARHLRNRADHKTWYFHYRKAHPHCLFIDHNPEDTPTFMMGMGRRRVSALGFPLAIGITVMGSSKGFVKGWGFVKVWMRQP